MHTMISNIIYVKFQILLLFFISQKSWLQQADHHQRCSFRQPSQLERTVSKRLPTHTHWLLPRELTENPWMLSNSQIYERSVYSGSFLLPLFTCNRQQAPDLFADCMGVHTRVRCSYDFFILFLFCVMLGGLDVYIICCDAFLSMTASAIFRSSTCLCVALN